MISSKKDYQFYLNADKLALGINRRYPRLFTDEVWKYERRLRKTEYLKNCKRGIFGKLFYVFSRYLLERRAIRLGFEIPLNAFGPGLSIAHRGTITVNGNARIGANCRIQNNVTIGANGGTKAPQIGDNVFIGPCATILGNIIIADNIAIGANSVVNKSFLEKSVTIAGAPAKVINSNKGSETILAEIKEKLNKF